MGSKLLPATEVFNDRERKFFHSVQTRGGGFNRSLQQFRSVSSKVIGTSVFAWVVGSVYE